MTRLKAYRLQAVGLNPADGAKLTQNLNYTGCPVDPYALAGLNFVGGASGADHCRDSEFTCDYRRV